LEIWNESNLTRERGTQSITRQCAAEYVYLLRLAYQADHGADPGINLISEGLSPTNSNESACCAPDDEHLQWLYQECFKGSFNVRGANANVQCPCVDLAPGSLTTFNQPSFSQPSFSRRSISAHSNSSGRLWSRAAMPINRSG
jgi:hypothetical protein